MTILDKIQKLDMEKLKLAADIQALAAKSDSHIILNAETFDAKIGDVSIISLLVKFRAIETEKELLIKLIQNDLV